MLVYLEKSSNFEQSLPDDTRSELMKGAHGKFAKFPMYDTAIGDLRACQINLLAAQAEYSLRENKVELLEFCKARPSSPTAQSTASTECDSSFFAGGASTIDKQQHQVAHEFLYFDSSVEGASTGVAAHMPLTRHSLPCFTDGASTAYRA